MRFFSLYIRAILYVGLVCSALVALDIKQLIAARNVDLEDAVRSTDNLVSSIAQHVFDAFAATDITIKGLRDNVEDDDIDAAAMGRLSRQMRRRVLDQDIISRLFFFGADGVIIASSLDDTPILRDRLRQLNFSDRDYFIYHRDHSSREMLLGKAVQSKIDGLSQITLSRRVNRPDGGFAGTIVASISLESFQRFFAGFTMGERGAITLVTRQGIVLVRRPFELSNVGRDISASAGFPRHDDPTVTGHFTFPSLIDKITRIGSFHRVAPFDLVVIVALNRDEVLAPGQTAALWHGLWLAATVILIAVLGSRIIVQIHGRARAETALAASQATLESRVVERTATLHKTESALRQAQKMELIGTLAGGLAHDFNNLLGVIIGNLDLANETIMPDDVKDLLDGAMTAALSGADLNRSLLTFARRGVLSPTLIDLNALVSSTTALLSRTLGTHIEIGLALAPDLAPVMIDHAQLQSCLVNLAANARDAMPHGGRLTVTTANRDIDTDDRMIAPDNMLLTPGCQPGHYVMLAVTDTGIGMSSAVMARIFEPFFTTKETGKGTGLGLSMVFGFIHQSGGHIRVYSEPGIGTTFTVLLPATITDDPPVSVPLIPATRPVAPADMTILVVDDNALFRAVVVRQLVRLGYHVVEADAPQAALVLLRTTAVDLVFTDIIMPGGMNGFDLAQRIAVEFPASKILLTSGFIGVSAPADQPLAYDILIKPYRLEQLGEAVQRALEPRATPE